MKIKFNKKLILTYLNIGVVSFVLTGCSIKNKDVNINNTVAPIETISPIDNTVEVIWHIPDGYKLVNKNGVPKGVKTIQKEIMNTMDIIYTVPIGYELIEKNGIKYGRRILDNGEEQLIPASISLPENTKDYTIRFINGVPKAVKKSTINLLEYVDVTYELPEGYVLDYINGEFVGVLEKVENEEVAKVLIKENSN